jgi:hypothetical protein
MYLTRSWYRELGIELFSLEKNHSLHPKRHPMGKEKRYERVSDPFKTLLKESLM